MLRMKLRFAAFQPLLVIPEVFLRPRDKIPVRVSTPMPFRDCSLEFAGAISPSVRVPSRSHALLNVVSGPADVHGQQVTIHFADGNCGIVRRTLLFQSRVQNAVLDPRRGSVELLAASEQQRLDPPFQALDGITVRATVVGRGHRRRFGRGFDCGARRIQISRHECKSFGRAGWHCHKLGSEPEKYSLRRSGIGFVVAFSAQLSARLRRHQLVRISFYTRKKPSLSYRAGRKTPPPGTGLQHPKDALNAVASERPWPTTAIAPPFWIRKELFDQLPLPVTRLHTDGYAKCTLTRVST